jgi:hypothetical protein
MSQQNFDVIILIGRPASGKSEIIDFLKKLPDEERRERFHINKFEEIDDFPMLWTWFEEDAILEKILKQPRIHTDKEGYFLYEYQWHLLIERISMEYSKKLRDKGYHDEFTSIIEFSRGTEHGGYKTAFQHLSEEILKKAGIIFINVTYEESLRKNRRRFNPERPDSILEHGLPDEKLEKMYKEVDWQEVSAPDSQFIDIKGIKVPYVVFENMPEKTLDPKLLGTHLEEIAQNLWAVYKKDCE